MWRQLKCFSTLYSKSSVFIPIVNETIVALWYYVKVMRRLPEKCFYESIKYNFWRIIVHAILQLLEYFLNMKKYFELASYYSWGKHRFGSINSLWDKVSFNHFHDVTILLIFWSLYKKHLNIWNRYLFINGSVYKSCWHSRE